MISVSVPLIVFFGRDLFVIGEWKLSSWEVGKKSLFPQSERAVMRKKPAEAKHKIWDRNWKIIIRFAKLFYLTMNTKIWKKRKLIISFQTSKFINFNHNYAFLIWFFNSFYFISKALKRLVYKLGIEE